MEEGDVEWNGVVQRAAGEFLDGTSGASSYEFFMFWSFRVAEGVLVAA